MSTNSLSNCKNCLDIPNNKVEISHWYNIYKRTTGVCENDPKNTEVDEQTVKIENTSENSLDGGSLFDFLKILRNDISWYSIIKLIFILVCLWLTYRFIIINIETIKNFPINDSTQPTIKWYDVEFPYNDDLLFIIIVGLFSLPTILFLYGIGPITDWISSLRPSEIPSYFLNSILKRNYSVQIDIKIKSKKDEKYYLNRFCLDWNTTISELFYVPFRHKMIFWAGFYFISFLVVIFTYQWKIGLLENDWLEVIVIVILISMVVFIFVKDPVYHVVPKFLAFRKVKKYILKKLKTEMFCLVKSIKNTEGQNSELISRYYELYEFYKKFNIKRTPYYEGKFTLYSNLLLGLILPMLAALGIAQWLSPLLRILSRAISG
ncbi:MAG: hypothetical protein OEZ01_17395 [Candidatus Heimdallarchaeota archaeon]|nr:hypothetical protein [Candidatus Heimdallarchaeota archaeon]MDH5647790.1 hypothetical protein [Candidatus Heimdallarchaeota archaeon]